jgi:hypothetical protein
MGDRRFNLLQCVRHIICAAYGVIPISFCSETKKLSVLNQSMLILLASVSFFVRVESVVLVIMTTQLYHLLSISIIPTFSIQLCASTHFSQSCTFASTNDCNSHAYDFDGETSRNGLRLHGTVLRHPPSVEIAERHRGKRSDLARKAQGAPRTRSTSRLDSHSYSGNEVNTS